MREILFGVCDIQRELEKRTDIVSREIKDNHMLTEKEEWYYNIGVNTALDCLKVLIKEVEEDGNCILVNKKDMPEDVICEENTLGELFNKFGLELEVNFNINKKSWQNKRSMLWLILEMDKRY